MKSNPSIESHKTPITGIEFIGGRNSPGIVSTSEEGWLCVWPLNKFDSTKKLDIKAFGNKIDEDEYALKLEPISLTSVPGDSNIVYIGCND